jgi:2-C-methyl-D-erythritol 4-phosphate cytidylyltransferase
MEASAIVVAGGKSVRANGIDKNFFKVEGNYVVEYSLEVFKNIEEISEIILVVNDNNYQFAKELERKYGVLLVKGGAVRAESVKNGVVAAKNEFVIVHDGARPFVSKELVKRVIKGLSEFPCVIPVVPVKYTIKEVENDLVVKTPDRKKLFEVQTPEGFRKKDLLALYDDFSSLDDSVFDESILFERAGKNVKVIEGDDANLKITTAFDLLLVEVLAKRWKQK